MAILAMISTAFDNSISESAHFQSLWRLRMAAPAALRSPAALAGPGQAIHVCP
jgi:hypothetical protein